MKKRYLIPQKWNRLRTWMRRQLCEKTFWAMVGWVITFTFTMFMVLVLFHFVLYFTDRLSGISVNTADLAQGEIIASLLATVFLVIQLRRENCTEYQQNLIQQCDFVKEYNQMFIENNEMAEVESRLEAFFVAYVEFQRTKDQNTISGAYKVLAQDMGLPGSVERQEYINYLVYLEGLSASVLNYAMSIEVINNLFGYRYFVAVNNPVIQEKELLFYSEYYQGIFKVYRKWIDYYQKKYEIGEYYAVHDFGYMGIPMHADGYALSRTEEFFDINRLPKRNDPDKCRRKKAEYFWKKYNTYTME